MKISRPKNHFWGMVLLLLTGFSTAHAQYCQPTYNNPCTSDDMIDGFEFNTISNLNTGCTSPGVNNYTDYSATIGTSAIQGASYNVTCTPGSNWGQSFGMWIDFNQDGDFDEVNEFFNLGYAAGGATVTTNITIPTGVMGGNTQMRVLCHFGTTPIVQTDACANHSWGETEDYAVTVSSPPAFDAAVNAIFQPNTGCGLGQESVEMELENNGTDTIQNLIVCYNIDGGAPACDTLSNMNFLPGTSLSYIHSTLADVSMPADYTFDAWVILVADSVPGNDTLTGYMMTSVPTITGIPYMEDFESGTGGWVPTGALSTWEYGVPAETNVFSDTSGACANNNGWATGLTTPYNNNEASFLESPCIDFSALTTDPYIRFDHLFQTEGGFDYHWVEISIDGGATWAVLGGQGTGQNWYNTANGWDGNSYTTAGAYRTAQHVLTGTAGQSDVRIRFAMSSDGSVQREGVAIDNIMINSTFVDASAIDITAPNSACGLTTTEPVGGTFFNNGSDTLFALPVCFSVNNGAQVCETITDTIAPNTAYSYTFTATADLSTPGDYIITLASALASDGNGCNDSTSTIVTHVPEISTYPYLETFESGQGGWTINNGANGTWAFGTPNKSVIQGAASGVNAFTTGGLGAGAYNVNEASFVNSPCFDFTNLPQGSWVAMSVWWESENSWDGANLQVSTDSGATWQNVGAFGAPAMNNWYNDNTINGTPGGSQEGWTGNTFNNGSMGWVAAKHPLDSALVGEPNVRLRVAFGSDGSVVGDGFAFDNVAISMPPTIDLGPDYAGCGINVDPGLPGTYEWFFQDTAQATAPVLVSTANDVDLVNNGLTDTTYNVIVVYTDTFGLCASDTMMATISPTPFSDLGMDTAICYNDTLWFTADTTNNANHTYMWNNGTTVDSAMYVGTAFVSNPTASVTVTDNSSGCVHTASVMVNVTAPVDLVDSVDVCEGDNFILDAGSMYTTFAWSTGDSTQTIVADATGVYTVTVTDGIGCVSTDSATIELFNLPAVNITGAPDTMCVNHVLTFGAGAGFFSYVWSTGGTSANETVDGANLNAGQTNMITVTVTDGNGCVNTDTANVFVDACVGIGEMVGDLQVNYYPNPVADVLFVEVTNGTADDLRIEVLDLQGKVVQTQAINNGDNRYRLNVGQLARGIYYLRLQSTTGTHIGKIVVQ